MTITWQTPSAAQYVSVSAGSVGINHPTGTAEGDKLLLIVAMKPSVANGGTCGTPSGWNLSASITGAGGYGTTLAADTGNTNLWVFERTVPAGGMPTTYTDISVNSNNITWAIILRLTSDAGWDSVAAVTGSDTSAGSVSIAFASNPGVAAGDLVIGAMCIPTDVTTPSQFSAEAFSQAGATFGAVVEVVEPDTATNNDLGGFVCYAPVSSGTATGNPTMTATASGTTTNVRGPGVFIRVRESSVASITGTMSATESGSDTIAGTGAVGVGGTMSASEAGADTMSASGSVGVSGTMAVVESGADGFAAAGTVGGDEPQATQRKGASPQRAARTSPVLLTATRRDWQAPWETEKPQRIAQAAPSAKEQAPAFTLRQAPVMELTVPTLHAAVAQYARAMRQEIAPRVAEFKAAQEAERIEAERVARARDEDEAVALILIMAAA